MLKNMLEYIFGKNDKKSNPKNTVTSVDVPKVEEESSSGTTNTSKKIIAEINYNYKLPDTSILNDELIRTFIEENRSKKELMIPIGKENNTIYSESLQSMPNIIIGGTVMSGKSSFIHTIISTILMCKKPYETKLIIFDSKMVEYSQYNGLPHLMIPVINDAKKVSSIMGKIVKEMEHRYDLFKSKNVKNITQYNNLVESINERIPDLIIIIDDYDSYCVIDKINDSLEYITKNGWNANIYVIIASNHPSSQVISAISKSNIPARLCFKVPAVQDSIVILDEPGANKLSGIGKALYKSRYISTAKCIETQIIDENIIRNLIDYCISQQKIIYNEQFLISSFKESYKSDIDEEYDDPLYNDIVEFVITTGKASASLLQRRFKLGYNRAARIVDLLEERGIIGLQIGSKPREVLVKLDNKD